MKLNRNEINGWIVASVSAPTDEIINGKYRYQGWKLCMDWCQEQFQDRNWRYVGEGVFEFRRVDDYTIFLLRWS